MKTRISNLFIMVLITMMFAGCDIDGPEFKYNVKVPKGAHADAEKLKYKPISAEQKERTRKSGFPFCRYTH